MGRRATCPDIVLPEQDAAAITEHREKRKRTLSFQRFKRLKDACANPSQAAIARSRVIRAEADATAAAAVPPKKKSKGFFSKAKGFFKGKSKKKSKLTPESDNQEDPGKTKKGYWART